MGLKEGGLYKDKYFIQKSRWIACGCRSAEECLHTFSGGMVRELVAVDPQAQYFVLRLDTDPSARVAVRTYARAIASSNPLLAQELTDWVWDLQQKAEA